MMPARSAAAARGLPSFRTCSLRTRSRRFTAAVYNYQPASADHPHSRQKKNFAQLVAQHAEAHVSDASWLEEPADSHETLQRALLQLQADNTELQAEIQHLAATLRAALASSPEAGQAGCLDGEPSFQRAAQHHPDLQHILQDLGQHQHSHAHLATGTPACSGGGDSGAHFDVATGAAGAPPVYHQPTEVSQATLSCSMQHPGSICCSKLSAAVDPEGASCAVSLHTTARCTADGATVHRHLSPEELRALAAHALVSAAHSFSQQAAAEYRAKGGPQQDVASRHAELVRVLGQGLVVSGEPMPPSQFDHKSYLLTLQDPHTAQRVRAIYKPRVYGDAGGWHRTPMEWVAYRLNLLLGMDLVPPVAYRCAPLSLSLGEEEEEVVFQEGAMMLWVEGCRQLREAGRESWGADPDALLSDTRILDVLLHNSDRHHGHFLLGPHWAHGRQAGSSWQGDCRPILIDHAASFRKEAVVGMEHENAFGTGPVRCVSAATYLRLRFLDAHAVAQELGQHLSRAEQRALLHRRDYVLRYLDDLVARQGYAATVRE